MVEHERHRRSGRPVGWSAHSCRHRGRLGDPPCGSAGARYGRRRGSTAVCRSTGAEPPTVAQEPTLRVSQLTAAVQVALDVCFPDEVWVRGEISSLQPGQLRPRLLPPDRAGATRRAAGGQGGGHALRLGQGRGQRHPEAGRRRAHDRRRRDPHPRPHLVYGPQGQLQLRMTAIDPDYTLGRLASDRERILLALASTGCSTATPGWRCRRGRGGSAWSPASGSAAEADFLHELDQQRAARSTWWWSTARVQGRDADRGRWPRRWPAWSHARVEVVAVVRGGGARTDLAAFDERAAGPGHRRPTGPGAHRHRPRDRHQRRRPGGHTALQDADRLCRPPGGPGPSVPRAGRDRSGGISPCGSRSAIDAERARVTSREATRGARRWPSPIAAASPLDERRRRLARAAPRLGRPPQLRLDVARRPGSRRRSGPDPGPGLVDHPHGRRHSSSATPTRSRPGDDAGHHPGRGHRPQPAGRDRHDADQFALRPRGDDHER